MTTVIKNPLPYRATRLRISSAVLTLMLATATIPAMAGSTASSSADKFYLVYRAQMGQTKKMKEEASLKFDNEGQPVSMEYKDVSTVTFSKVTPQGEVTLQDKTDSEEYIVNGQKQDPNGDSGGDISTVTIQPNGIITAYSEEKKNSGDDADKSDDDHIGVRMDAATTVIFPDHAVGVGEKWSRDFKADSELGTRDAHADFELLSFEKVNGVDCVKVQMTYTEAGNGGITTKGISYTEVATGDLVRDSFEAQNVPLVDSATASGTFTDERVDGGPYAVGQMPKPLTEAPKYAAAPPPDPTKPVATAAKPGDVKVAELPKPPDVKKDKTIDDTVKDFTKIPGILTLWRKKDMGKDTIYAEVPEDKLGKLLLLQATAATGNADQVIEGDPINDLVFKLDKQDDRIFLTVPNYLYRANNAEIARSVHRSFADSYLLSFRIEAKQADRKSILIDVSDLFRGDFAQISAAFGGGGSPFAAALGGGGGYGMDRDKTYIKDIKNFPENLVVTTQYNFMHGGRGGSGALADPRSAAITVDYNLTALPEAGSYMPRLADDRIGYFEAAYQSFDDDNKRDQIVRYILRWDLKKKDPNAPISEPVKPITFWLDNAIPKDYRPAFRDGLLVWNQAFEKVGIKNAIVVKEMPDNPDPSDTSTPTDVADTRFNFIRYVTSPDGAYAVTQFRQNPLTGQILNGSITVDAGLIRYTKIEHDKEVQPYEAFAYGAGIPQEQERLKKQFQLSAAPNSRAALFGPVGAYDDPRSCSFAQEAVKEAQFGYLALAAMSPTGTLSPIEQKEYTTQFIREVVSHEFGHMLGLRHNFIASTQFSLAQLGKKEVTDAGGIGASVMDYNAFNISALNKSGASFYATNIGTYDRWAIEYGYTQVPAAKTPDDEKFSLGQIAMKSGLPGHAYLSDEVADSFDPSVVRFDLSADPLGYWKKTMEVSRKLLSTLDKREPKNGESYWEFTQDFDTLFGVYARGAGYSSRFIGGQNISHTHLGDVGEKPALSPVSPAKQREALDVLNTNVFAPNALPVPQRYYAKMASDPNDFGADEAPMLDRLSSVQKSAINRLFSPVVLGRVANNEFKSNPADKPLTLPYLFDSVTTNIWAELPAHKNVDALRRNLQRDYVDKMTDIALKGGVNADAQMLAWGELRSLKTKLTAAKSIPTLDTYTRDHYADTLDKIDRTLEARVTIGESSGPSLSDLLGMLLGRTANNGSTATATTGAAAPNAPAAMSDTDQP